MIKERLESTACDKSSETSSNSSHCSLNKKMSGSNCCVQSAEDTTIHLDLPDHHSDVGYCNDDHLSTDEEATHDSRSLTSTHSSMDELNNLSTHQPSKDFTVDLRSVSVDADVLYTSDSETSLTATLDSLEALCMERSTNYPSVISEGYVKHNSSSTEVELNCRATTPLCEARRSSVNSVSSTLGKPTSPIVEFDFGVSTLNFYGSQDALAHSPAMTSSTCKELETADKSEVAFDFGMPPSSDMEFNADTASLHEGQDLPNYSHNGLALNMNDVKRYMETPSGYVVDTINGANHGQHHHCTTTFFDFCNSKGCDKSDLYTFNKHFDSEIVSLCEVRSLGEHRGSDALSPISISLGELNSSNEPSLVLVRPGYVSGDILQ